MRDLKFEITKEVLDLGVKIITARIAGVQNTESNVDLETYKNAELENNGTKGTWPFDVYPRNFL